MTAPQDPFLPPGERPVGGTGATGTPGTGWGAQGSSGPGWGAAPSDSPGWGAAPGSGGGPPGGQPWGSAPYGSGGPAGPARNGLGVAALVLGLLALLTSVTIVGGIVLGLAAIVLGALGRGRARRGEASNGGTATAGIVLGVLGAVLAVVLLAAGVALFQSDQGQELVDCLERAGSDTAAQQACQREFTEQLG
jgi:hypothetical protein